MLKKAPAVEPIASKEDDRKDPSRKAVTSESNLYRAQQVGESRHSVIAPLDSYNEGGLKRLGRSFKPGAFDVICGRVTIARNHLGNLNLKRKIEEMSNAYSKAQTKADKSMIVTSIVEWIRSQSPHGGFVRQANDGVWHEVSNTVAREKVGQALRDRSQSQYNSDPESHKNSLKNLGPSFEPGAFDVICGRGAEAKNHRGNLAVKRKIAEASDAYTAASTKLDKSTIVSSIVEWVRLKSPNGGFVKKMDDGEWYEVGNAMAREKIGQAFRDRNHLHYKSSMKAKRRRWAQAQKPPTQQQHILAEGRSSSANEALQNWMQYHRETIQYCTQIVIQRWKEHGGQDANDEQVLELFTQHNKHLLETLKNSTPLGDEALDVALE